MFNKIIKPLTLIFYLLFIACLAVFTFVEKYKGAAFAKEYLYYSYWFTALCIFLLLIGFTAFIFLYKKKTLSVILVYSSLIIIALGYFFTVFGGDIGMFFTYFGYAMFTVSMLMVLFRKKGRFRSLLKMAMDKNLLLVLLLFSSVFLHSQPNTLSKEQAAQMGKWQVLHNNRMMPLQTLAKDFTVKLTGTDHYGKFSAEQVFFGWIFYPQQWQAEPLISLKNKDLKQRLRIKKNASYNDLLALENQSIIENYCLQLERANKQNLLHKTVYEIN